MFEARKAYREAKKSSIRLSKLYYYLETNKMLKTEQTIHPIENKQYESKYIPSDFADNREWNYLMNLCKYKTYKSVVDLYSHSERLGNKMLDKINSMRNEFPMTKENIQQHLDHHRQMIEMKANEVDKERVGRLLRQIDETRIGLLNTLILNLHYI